MSHRQPIQPKFELGRPVATPGALKAIEAARQSPAEFLTRHVTGDWGDLSEDDKQLNDAALGADPARILSAYHTNLGVKLWVITEWDRSVTTILLPEEY